MCQSHRALGVCCHTAMALLTHTLSKSLFSLLCSTTTYWAIYKYSPESASTCSTIVRIDSDLIIRPQPNRTIGMIFWPRPRFFQPIWSFLRLFLVFDCRLFLNRIVGSSHRRDIFPTTTTSGGIEQIGLPEYLLVELSTTICQIGSEYQFKRMIIDCLLFSRPILPSMFDAFVSAATRHSEMRFSCHVVRKACTWVSASPSSL